MLDYRREALAFNEYIETKHHEPCELNFGRFGKSLLPFLDTTSSLAIWMRAQQRNSKGRCNPNVDVHAAFTAVSYHIDTGPYSSIDLNEIYSPFSFLLSSFLWPRALLYIHFRYLTGVV